MFNIINNLSFKGIINPHVHAGHWYHEGTPGHYYGKEFTDSFKTLNNLNREPECDTFTSTGGIDKMIVSDIDTMADDYYAGEYEGNENALKIFGDDDFYALLAVCRPDKTNGDISDIQRLFDTYPEKFTGLKLHPEAMNMYADDYRCDPYMKFARKNNLPCMFHSEGEGVSGVESIYNLAKRFPDVPVILAHMGAGGADCHNRAISVFERALQNNDADIYVDLSWVDWENGLPSYEKPSVKKVIDTALKYNALDKILFATDTPLGCFGEHTESSYMPQETYNLSVDRLASFIKRNYPDSCEEIKDKIFHDNAAKLFGI